MSENISGRPSAKASSTKEQLGLPFNQYQRHKVVADALDVLREDSKPLRILDVGGGEEGVILRFLPNDSVEVLDQMEAEDIPGFVRGDATALPHEDEAFDYVVSVDTYEHIESGQRSRYLSELRRVARKGVLLAAPFNSDEVRGAERLVNQFHQAIHLQENVRLKEHEENGLPDLDDTRQYFEEQGDQVSILPNGYLPHWVAMLSLTFYNARLRDEMRSMADQVNAFYNEFMYKHDNIEPSYRHLLVALKEDEGAGLERLISPSTRQRTADPSTALFGAFSAVLPLMAHLKQKDGQLAQKEAQIRDLSRRLAEQTVAMQRQEIRLQRQLDAVTSSRGWKLLETQRKLRTFVRGRLGGSGG